MARMGLRQFVGFVVGSLLATACGKVDFKNDPSNDCQGLGSGACVTTGGIDYFTENISVPFPNNRTDILVVTDDSQSMVAEQAAMGARFGSFLSQITNLDWRIGMVTTDMSGNGPTQGGNLLEYSNTVGGPGTGIFVLNPSTPGAGSLFAGTVQRIPKPPGPAGDERAIWASIEAMNKSAALPESDTRRLVRSDAKLAVVILSDEDERSRGGALPGYPLEPGRDFPQDLINKVSSLWPSKSLTVHGIVIRPGDSACLNQQAATGGSGNAAYANVYADLVARTGGILGDICAPDYGGQLAQMGQITGSNLQSHNIRCTPLEGTVRVTTSTGQTYDCPRGPVSGSAPICRFEGAKIIFAPPLMAGQQVTVQYGCPKN